MNIGLSCTIKSTIHLSRDLLKNSLSERPADETSSPQAYHYLSYRKPIPMSAMHRSPRLSDSEIKTRTLLKKHQYSPYPFPYRRCSSC